MKRLNIPKLLFFLIIVFLPQQFGPHFWPPFSFINGIRLDYLSPTLYISDLLIILLFLFSAKNIFKNKQTISLIGNKLFLFFLLVLVIPLLYCAQQLSLLFGMLKLFEFFYFGLYVSAIITKKDFKTLVEIFAILGVAESILAAFQFLNQGSIGGVLYFVGERTYSLSTPGIAAMNTSKGLLVRPYGTFPHPNVLAFFLFTCIVLSSYAMHHSKKARRYLFFSAIIIIEAGLFVTFSRTVLLINIIFLLYSFGYVSLRESGKRIKNILFIFFLFAFTLFYLFLNSTRFLNPSGIIHDIIPREDLIQLGWSALLSSPLFGLGLNNFYYFEGQHQTNFSSIYLQPVHNIFLLIAVQVGILGLIAFLYFLTLGLQRTWKGMKNQKKIFSYSEIPLMLLLSVLFVGSLDHFFLTVQQGELMFALILGLVFSKKISGI